MEEQRRRVCARHYYKVIFYTKDEVVSYMQIHHPSSNYATYPCPVEKSHLHTRTRKTRKRTTQQREAQRQRAKARLENEE